MERRLGQRVLELEPLLGGACQDNFLVVTSEERLVLRSDPVCSLPGSVNRAVEFEVIQAARRAGVPTPTARWPSSGLVREGAEAYFLEWCDGVAIAAKVLRDPRLEEARRRLPEQLARALRAIHSITGVEVLGQPPDDPVDAALRFQRRALDDLPEHRPALELAYRWLDENRPGKRPVTLVHGDFRMGNFMVTPEGLAGVLDWEFAHWGDPVEDLGWLCVRDWRFGNLKQPAGGLCGRKEFCELYGEKVDPAVLHFWEVFGNVRWGGGAVAQGQRFFEVGEIELLAIGRRAPEMEYEALRLIEVGPEVW